MWTEAWSGWYKQITFAKILSCERLKNVYWLCCLFAMMAKRFTEFGGTIPKRPVEDLAFGVARFIQKGGSYINYYMVNLIHQHYENLFRFQSQSPFWCLICGSTMEEQTLVAQQEVHLSPLVMTMMLPSMNTVQFPYSQLCKTFVSLLHGT